MRESGAIEQDADIVTFIYRPEYYGITEDEEGNSTIGTGDIIIAKHRNGSLDTVTLKFIPHLAKFDNIDSFDFGEFPGSNLEPNDDFDTPPGTITRGSKMNDFDGNFSDGSDNDDTPF